MPGVESCGSFLTNCRRVGMRVASERATNCLRFGLCIWDFWLTLMLTNLTRGAKGAHWAVSMVAVAVWHLPYPDWHSWLLPRRRWQRFNFTPAAVGFRGFFYCELSDSIPLHFSTSLSASPSVFPPTISLFSECDIAWCRQVCLCWFKFAAILAQVLTVVQWWTAIELGRHWKAVIDRAGL